MILSDAEIKKRVEADKLLEFHDPNKIKYCGCELSLGKVVTPRTGDVLSLERTGRKRLGKISKQPKCFVIEPSETIILLTKERLNMPANLCATYGQLNRLANMGLMILNTSIVEPGYSGPLSCVLVNFSSQRHSLAPGDSIAKVNFHSVQGAPEKLFSQSFGFEEYERLASKNAINLPKSLLDISGVEDRVTKTVQSGVRRSIVLGGVVILVLLLWSQMEGFLSDWIYKRTGIMDTKQVVETKMDELLKQQQVKDQKQNDEFRKEIADLQKHVENQHHSKGSSPGGAKQ
jgi:deoxycytidine triphosphate deaminase